MRLKKRTDLSKIIQMICCSIQPMSLSHDTLLIRTPQGTFWNLKNFLLNRLKHCLAKKDKVLIDSSQKPDINVRYVDVVYKICN